MRITIAIAGFKTSAECERHSRNGLCYWTVTIRHVPWPTEYAIGDLPS